MIAATYILFVLGCLGATDILLYHSISHGIRTHHDSRGELIVHSLRGPTYAALFLLVPNFTLHGYYFWALIALLAFDVGISLADFMLERKSRAFLGGLPSGEYVLHIVLAMLFGALVTSTINDAWTWNTLPSAIEYQPAGVPALLRATMAIMALMVLWSGAMDLVAAIRLGRAPQHEP